MTRIEQLLRDALREVPVPPTAADPVAAVDARVRRTRRALVAALASAAIVAAAVAVPLLAVGDGDRRTEPIAPSPSPSVSATPQVTTASSRPVVWREHETYAVASDGRSVWAAIRSVRGHERWYVVRQDPATGRELQRVEVPGPVDVLAVGLGRVWAGGGGDGAYPDGVVNAVNPSTGTVATHRFAGAGPSAFAFTGGAAWAAVTELQQVDRLDFAGGGPDLMVGASVSLGVAPNRLVSTEDGSLWANELGRRQIIEIVVDDGPPHVGASYRWPGPILGPLARHTLWTSAAPNAGDLRSLQPRSLRCCPSLAQGYRLAVPGKPLVALSDDHGGVYVALYARTVGIAYLRDYSHLPGNAPPTDFLPIKNAFRLAIDPAGGVVFTANQKEYRWTP